MNGNYFIAEIKIAIVARWTHAIGNNAMTTKSKNFIQAFQSMKWIKTKTICSIELCFLFVMCLNKIRNDFTTQMVYNWSWKWLKWPSLKFYLDLWMIYTTILYARSKFKLIIRFFAFRLFSSIYFIYLMTCIHVICLTWV